MNQLARADYVVGLLFQFGAVNPTEALLAFREHRFHPTRRWRFDLAWPAKHVAVEIDGGSWIGGRHTTGTGFEKDLEKMNEAICLGWKVLRFTPSMVEDGTALGWLERALNA